MAKINVMASEGDLTSASNVNNATVVRLYNTHSADLLITRKTAAPATVGTVTVKTGTVELIEKDPTDTLEAASNGNLVKVVSIAYSS
jgi:hypothetical protein